MKATPKQTKKVTSSRARQTKPVSPHPALKSAKLSDVSKLSLRKKVSHHAKKLLIPHKGNDYRPHLIRAHGLVAVLVLALAAQTMYGFVTTGRLSVLGEVSNIQTSDLLAKTNQQREANGVADLQLNAQLNQAAYLKVQDMFAMQYWAHTSPSGVQPWKWFGDVGYNYSVAGENLAKNYPTAQATVDAWMNSPTHRANILNAKYVDVGFAVMEGTLDNQDTTLVVALYGAPVTTAVQAASIQPTNTSAQHLNFSAPAVAAGSSSPLAYFASAIQSLNPVSVATLALLGVVALVGIAAHHYRKKLPKTWQHSWRLHHGLYTFVGMIALGVLVIIASGGGSI